MCARQILSVSLVGNLICLAYWSLKSYRENNVRALDATVLIADFWTLELPCVIVHAHKQYQRLEGTFTVSYVSAPYMYTYTP